MHRHAELDIGLWTLDRSLRAFRGDHAQRRARSRSLRRGSSATALSAPVPQRRAPSGVVVRHRVLIVESQESKSKVKSRESKVFRRSTFDVRRLDKYFQLEPLSWRQRDRCKLDRFRYRPRARAAWREHRSHTIRQSGTASLARSCRAATVGRPRSQPRPKSNVQSPKSGSLRRLWTLDLGLWTDLYSRWDNPIRADCCRGRRV